MNKHNFLTQRISQSPGNNLLQMIYQTKMRPLSQNCKQIPRDVFLKFGRNVHLLASFKQSRADTGFVVFFSVSSRKTKPFYSSCTQLIICFILIAHIKKTGFFAY